MIAVPLNDRACLDKMTALAVEATKRDDVRALAQRFQSPRALAAWIRSLPQRDDDGNATDGPRVTCDVSQRVRIGADDPNCVERSLLYIATSELLDAEATRALATIETPAGRHTFPVENGRPVVLDPNMRRNALAAGLWLMSSAQRNAAAPIDANPRELLAWLADIAEEPATDRDGGAGRDRIARARRALARMFDGAQLDGDQVDDVLYMLDHASDASELFGRAGRYGAQLARAALARLGVGTRRNQGCSCECPCSSTETEPEVVGPQPLPVRTLREQQALYCRGPEPRPAFCRYRNVKVGGYNVRPDWDAIEKYGTTGVYLGGKIAATYYGGPLAGTLWDPAFQAATGKTPQKALAPLGAAAPIVGAATSIYSGGTLGAVGAAAQLGAAAAPSSGVRPPDKASQISTTSSTSTTTTQQEQPLALVTLAAFETRR